MARPVLSCSAYLVIGRGHAPSSPASGLCPSRACVRALSPGLQPILGACKQYRLRPLGFRRMVVIFLSPFW